MFELTAMLLHVLDSPVKEAAKPMVDSSRVIEGVLLVIAGVLIAFIFKILDRGFKARVEDVARNRSRADRAEGAFIAGAHACGSMESCRELVVAAAIAAVREPLQREIQEHLLLVIENKLGEFKLALAELGPQIIKGINGTYVKTPQFEANIKVREAEKRELESKIRANADAIHSMESRMRSHRGERGEED